MVGGRHVVKGRDERVARRDRWWRGVGRAIVERLLLAEASVVIVEVDPAALDWA